MRNKQVSKDLSISTNEINKSIRQVNLKGRIERKTAGENEIKKYIKKERKKERE